jgi:hypothetical protein
MEGNPDLKCSLRRAFISFIILGLASFDSSIFITTGSYSIRDSPEKTW